MSKAIDLSRRERQIMDIIYELGEATAQQVMEKLPDPPSYSAVRAMLRKLEDKGHLAHKEMGAKYAFYPLVEHDQASKNAITRLVRTFFDGSATQAVNALLGMSMSELPKAELEEIETMIRAAKEQENKKAQESKE
ncbi:BlaI/MecI/CopY family transcriptional regulator [Gammaproteobacteria bacterium]|nr:BlaI/MecI/CopY family transcriptional regulator [Gammaproteobacteria bacterium]